MNFKEYLQERINYYHSRSLTLADKGDLIEANKMLARKNGIEEALCAHDIEECRHA